MPTFIAPHILGSGRNALRRLFSRRGSILIMVVAVLVLLALMGTAYMSVARLDRQAAPALNAASSEEVIAQLVPAVEQMAEDIVSNDIYTLSMGYRPPPVPAGTNYDHWDSLVTNYRSPAVTGTVVQQNDAWLSSRVPDIMVVGALQRPSWRAITRPINQSATGGETMFESPFIDPQTTFSNPSTPTWLNGYIGSGTWSVDATTMRIAPADITITYPTTYTEPGLAGKTRVFPALQLTDLTGAVALDANGRQFKYLAGDADGDGIADSGLVYLTTVDNIRYYYACRIIDEGSAINISTAWSYSGDFGIGATAPNLQSNWCFPSSVGLLELLNTYNTGTRESDEMKQILAYRLNLTGGTIVAPLQPVADPYDPFNLLTAGSGDNNPTNRGDFDYVTQGEAMFEMLGRRLDYPGWREQTATYPRPSPDTFRYRAFALADHLDLSYRFDMFNPSTDLNTAGAADTLDWRMYTLGQADSFLRSSVNWAQTRTNQFRYLPADKWQYWSMWNFDFDKTRRNSDWGTVLGPTGDSGTPPLTAAPLRSLITTYNGVSNAIIKHGAVNGSDVPHASMLPYNTQGRWDEVYSNTSGYKAGNIVIQSYIPIGFPAAGPGITQAFYCIADYSGIGEPKDDTTMANWAPLVGRGQWTPTPWGAIAYTKGNLVIFDDPGTAAIENQLYVCYENGGGATPPNTDTTHWREVNAGPVPPKVSLNTAIFGELFRGFWNVMKSDIATADSPFDAAITADLGSYGGATLADPRGTSFVGTFNDPYVGNRFQPYVYDDASTTGPDPFQPVRTATVAGPAEHPARMFRSSIRGVPTGGGAFDAATPRLPSDQMVLLRSAIAAVNAEDLRDSDSDITAREIMLKAVMDTNSDGVAEAVPVSVVVYGNEPQPFITEVYVNTDSDLTGSGGDSNVNGYVAIELHNPYPFPISLANWVIATTNRANGSGPNRVLTPIADFSVAGEADETYPTIGGGLATVIDPYGYVLLENHNSISGAPPVGAAAYRPGSAGVLTPGSADSGQIAAPAGTSPPIRTIFVPGLGDNGGGLGLRTIANLELVLLRPRQADGTYSYNVGGSGGSYKDQPYSSGIDYDERPTAVNRLRDMVPVDSFDFTGLVIPLTGSTDPARVWHYVRRTNAAGGGAFHFVYPGRYDASVPVGTPRQAGTQESPTWNNGSTTANDPWNPATGGTPPGHPIATQGVNGPSMTFGSFFDEGATNTYIIPPTGDGISNLLASYGVQPSRPIQLSNYFLATIGAINVSCVGHNPVVGAAGNAFPFGGFMRNGDVLHVPFIGAYRVLEPTDLITAGGTLLEINAITMDAAMAEDTEELNDGAVSTGAYTEFVEQIGRFCPGWDTAAMPFAYTYDWATDVLDQFTAIQNYHDDFLPNVDPARYPAAVTPIPVANSPNVRPNTKLDRDAPVQGLINLNTAPAAVLSALPLVVTSAGTIDVAKTQDLANAIVRYRDVDDGSGSPHGAFKNLFELNDVIFGTTSNGFYNLMGEVTFAPTPGPPGDGQGDFTPYGATNDEVRMDYEERYLNLMRLSNLMTTRSDVYKAYVLIQGWKNAGTGTPQLVSERRSAFIIDRSKLASDNVQLDVTKIPTK